MNFNLVAFPELERFDRSGGKADSVEELLGGMLAHQLAAFYLSVGGKLPQGGDDASNGSQL
jgi:hypothetical protein